MGSCGAEDAGCTGLRGATLRRWPGYGVRSSEDSRPKQKQVTPYSEEAGVKPAHQRNTEGGTPGGVGGASGLWGGALVGVGGALVGVGGVWAVGGVARHQARGQHTCDSSLLEAAQDLLTQEMNQPSHNLGGRERTDSKSHILNQE